MLAAQYLESLGEQEESLRASTRSKAGPINIRGSGSWGSLSHRFRVMTSYFDALVLQLLMFRHSPSVPKRPWGHGSVGHRCRGGRRRVT